MEKAMTPPPPSAALAPPDPEYVAIILAATQGARLYPLTSEYSSGGTPKHLLPTSVLNDAVGGARDAASCPLVRLLGRAAASGQFGSVAVAVNAEDGMTSDHLVECGACRPAKDDEVAASAISRPAGDGGGTTDLIYGGERDGTGKGMHVRVVRLPDDCHGSADALRHLSRERHVPRSSSAVVMPGDLILEGQLLRSEGGDAPSDVLSELVDSHRRWNAGGPSSPGSAVTMILTDVGAEDRDGAPLKESSKAKLGLLSREEEDMDYVGLSSESAPPLSGSLRHAGGPAGDDARRVVMKRSKLEVEEDEGTGATPKVVLAKRRLHAAGSDRRAGGGGVAGAWSCSSATHCPDRSPSVTIRTDLHDVHLYALSGWVFDLIQARPSMQSLQNEVVPLLISRQYRGVEGAFGATSWRRDGGNRERLRRVIRGMDGGIDPSSDRAKVASLLGMYASGGLGGRAPGENGDPNDGGTGDGMDTSAGSSSVLGAPPPFPGTRHGYAVTAKVLSREASRLALRACTLPSLLHGCGAVTSAALGLGPSDAAGAVADGARLSSKFNSVLLSGCKVGEKVQTKACTVGRNVVLGDRSRLNNVVVMDGATVGSNTVLQNSIVGPGATVGDNCNLKDCQVGPGADVPSGTRTSERGETFEA